MQAGRLMLDLKGQTLLAEERDLLGHPQVGGVILFARNIATAEQVAALVAEIRALRPSLLLAVDQEGGRVQRLQEGMTRLPPMRRLGDLYERAPQAGTQAARLLGRLMASEVLQLGLDFSFAPVLDVDLGRCDVISDRAFSHSVQAVIALAGAFIDGMHQAGMAATGKHFPGHGWVSGDSHLCLPEDTRSLSEIEAACLQPFAALMQSLDGIMPAHVRYSQVDQLPAGFSPVWINYLRQTLHFRGMIFSDDLSMAGAAMAGTVIQRAQAALAAGCDQVLVCNQPEEAITLLQWMETNAISACDQAARMRATQTLSEAWLQSAEAVLARQVAGHLSDLELDAALAVM